MLAYDIFSYGLLSLDILIDGRYFYNSMPELEDVKPEKQLHCLITLQDEADLNLAARRVLHDVPDSKPKLRENFPVCSGVH